MSQAIPDWLVQYATQVAADLTVSLLGAVGRKVANQFKPPQEATLREALAANT